jgi:hypothetical protein
MSASPHARPGPRHARRKVHGAHAKGWVLRWARPKDSAAAGSGRRVGLTRLVPALLVALALALGAFAETAYAYFSASATGVGHGKVVELQAVGVLSATGMPTSDLFPGGKANLRVTIHNPNGFSVTIVAVAQDTTTALGVTGGNGCTGTNAEVTVPTNTSPTGTPTLSLPADTTKTLTIETGVTMGTTSPSGCQTASFQIPLTVTVRS